MAGLSYDIFDSALLDLLQDLGPECLRKYQNKHENGFFQEYVFNVIYFDYSEASGSAI